MKKNTWLVMGLVGALLFAGCGASNKAMTEAYDRAPVVENAMADGNFYYSSKSDAFMDSATGSTADRGFGYGSEAGMAETELYQSENEKLIRTVSMSLQTKEFETLLAYLDGKVAELGGYIQSSQIYGNSMDSFGYRSASMTLRIPQQKLDVFVSGVNENATVVRKSENAENVTLQYADTEARLKSLQIEQERFLALLEKADTVDSIIAIEQHLTELRYEIESYASTLKIYDNKVDYSTVSLDISEVNRVTPVEQNPTLLTRMKEGFSNTLYSMKEGGADFLVWLVTNFLYLVIWGVILVAVCVVLRRVWKQRKMKAAASKVIPGQQDDEEQHDRMDLEK